MNIQQSDSEDEEDSQFNNEIYANIESSSESEDEQNFDKEKQLVNNFKDLNNIEYINNKKEMNFEKNLMLLIKYGFNETKIREYYNKIFYMNHDILRKQLTGVRTTKGEMYLRMAIKFLKS